MSWCARGCEKATRVCGHRPGTRRLTSDPAFLEAHLRAGGNVGLVGATSVAPFAECDGTPGLVILDFDRSDLYDRMVVVLGPVDVRVVTGSGKLHAYHAAAPALLSRQIRWEDGVAGEVIRARGDYAVCPPSLHPKTGEPYRWVGDPLRPLAPLPAAWLSHLCRLGETELATVAGPRAEDLPRPAFIPVGDLRGRPGDWAKDEIWNGPDAATLLARALAQPNAHPRHDGGVKFRCAGCEALGKDRTGDNARVFPDGRWGCAVDRAHGRAIAVQLGVLTEAVVARAGRAAYAGKVAL